MVLLSCFCFCGIATAQEQYAHSNSLIVTHQILDIVANCTSDTDNDTVCDSDDICPGFDDLLIGQSCDDSDMCSTNDVWTTACICEGVISDSDGDGICDVFDVCPGPENQCTGYGFSNFNDCLDTNVIGVAEDFSGITYCYDSETFFTIRNSNNNESIYEIDFDGNILRTITLPNFHDTEAIVYLGNNQFAITEESRRRIVILNITANTTNINYPGSSAYIQITGTGIGNNGLEGLAYDAHHDILYIGKEYATMNIFVIEHPLSRLGTSISPTELFDAEALTDTYPSNGGFDDISGLDFSPNGTLMILTDEGEHLVEVQPFTGELLNSFGLGSYDLNQVEGISIVGPDQFYIVGEPNEIISFIRLNGACDDGDPCTQSDVYVSSCHCAGVLLDSDFDGTYDCNDACPSDPLKIVAGLCGCGVSDNDDDNDGVVNCNDLCPQNPLKTDLGFCGCDYTEIDDDSDGVPNCVDDCPLDPNKIFPGDCGCGTVDEDLDNNGISDCIEPCPPNIFISTFNSGYGFFIASDDISSDGVIHNSTIDLSAGDHIEFLSGFEVKKSNILHAYIDGCN